MNLPHLLAWTWTGHGQLTSYAVTAAIAQFFMLGKSFLENRFVEIEKVWKGVVGKTIAKDCLQDMLDTLPGDVQREDIHPANFPYWHWGEKLNPSSGQVRHFMRSSIAVSSLDAFNQSKAYINGHLTGAWTKYREAVYHEDKWYDLGQTSWGIFAEGNGELARALHTIEDSYAPGHVTRASPLGFIEEVHVWDDENKNPNPANDWPGHHALDDPSAPKSSEFFEMAKRTTADLIVCVLSNLDQDEATFRQDLGDRMGRYFYMARWAPEEPIHPPSSGTG
jgi:hypothetical protein